MKMASASANWFEIENLDEIESPALLIYPERVTENIRRMISIAGDAERLRPHVKTHKLGPIAALQMAAGITKFKAATLAEAEMLARAGAPDILLAYHRSDRRQKAGSICGRPFRPPLSRAWWTMPRPHNGWRSWRRRAHKSSMLYLTLIAASIAPECPRMKMLGSFTNSLAGGLV